MGFPEHKWKDYTKSGNLMEITIKDNTGRKLDFFRCNSNKDYRIVVGVLNKYGFTLK